jgi:hypothetical protein
MGKDQIKCKSNAQTFLMIIFHISVFKQELDINKLYSCENLMQKWFYIPDNMINFMRGSSCSWSYGNWIYNCLCNQCLSPLKLWVRIPLLLKTKCTPTDKEGPSWSWSYGNSIYNYLYNQCLSPLTLWVWILLMARCTW